MEALDIYPDLLSRRKTCIVTCHECFAREQKKTKSYASPGNRTMGMSITRN
jgi:hypothetical protein